MPVCLGIGCVGLPLGHLASLVHRKKEIKVEMGRGGCVEGKKGEKRRGK